MLVSLRERSSGASVWSNRLYLAAGCRTLDGMHSGTSWRLGHRPALDGLRGVAILLVMVSHAVPARAWGLGSLGVTVFFTLSGFLITSLLLDEHARTGRVALAAFWVRRVRRLGPALLVLVATLLVLSPIGASPTGLADAGAVLTYAGNWVAAFGLIDLGPLGHTWSLAIEEQFYLLWPLVLVLALRTRKPRTVLLALTAGGIAWAWVARWTLWNGSAGSRRIYYGTDTRMDALLVGCALSVLMTSRRPARPRWSRTMATDMTLTALIAVSVASLSIVPATYLIVPLYAPIVTAVVLAGATVGAYSGALNAGALRWFGRRAYGLYLWHVPVIIGAEHVARGIPHVIASAAGIALSVALAEVSWRIVERPILQPKSVRQAGRPGRGTSEPSFGSHPVSTTPIRSC